MGVSADSWQVSPWAGGDTGQRGSPLSGNTLYNISEMCSLSSLGQDPEEELHLQDKWTLANHGFGSQRDALLNPSSVMERANWTLIS